jgi:outer membrane lipoprotein-sorting protein
MEVFVNAENYRIVKSVGIFAIGTQPTSLSSEFSDFRTVDRVLFPFRIVNYARGNKISEITISRYLINPAIDDSLFNP